MIFGEKEVEEAAEAVMTRRGSASISSDLSQLNFIWWGEIPSFIDAWKRG